MTSPTTVLVTGGAGYIGSVTTERLLAAGSDVVVIDNLSTGHRAAVPATATLYEGDYGDASLLRRVFTQHGVTAVMHFAAETTVEHSMTQPRIYFRNNVVNGLTLLDAMLEQGCRRLVFSSTAAIFGEPVQTPITEDHPRQPVNAYGASKLMFEQILEWYGRCYGLAFAALRYFNAAGATERLGEAHDPETHLLPILLEVASGRRDLVQIYGSDYPTPDGTCVRDYIHVRDLADAHIQAMQGLDQGSCRVYNLGAGRGVSNLEALRMVERVSGRKVRFEFAGRRAGDPAILVAASGQAQRELGWAPLRSSLENIARSAWEWHVANPDGYQE